ncbi:hypothetical protein DNTS_010252, partial [Danionella cerebrum]
TCVNGSPVTSRQQLHHGDRILWGNNHFFRINLPKRRLRSEDEEGEGGNMKNSNSSEQLDGEGDSASEVSSEVSFSYEFAQTEVMMKALGSNEVLNRPPPEQPPLIPPADSLLDNTNPPSRAEITTAVKEIKAGKAAGCSWTMYKYIVPPYIVAP